MDLMRWDPREDFTRLRDDLNRFLDFPFRLGGWAGTAWTPSVDVYESGEEVVVEAEIPGFAPEDIDVRVTGEAVTIKGEKRKEEGAEGRGFYRRERRAESFYRVVALPAPVAAEQARAGFRNGVLEVRMPKAEPERGRRVPIEKLH